MEEIEFIIDDVLVVDENRVCIVARFTDGTITSATVNADAGEDAIIQALMNAYRTEKERLERERRVKEKMKAKVMELNKRMERKLEEKMKVRTQEYEMKEKEGERVATEQIEERSEYVNRREST